MATAVAPPARVDGGPLRRAGGVLRPVRERGVALEAPEQHVPPADRPADALPRARGRPRARDRLGLGRPARRAEADASASASTSRRGWSTAPARRTRSSASSASPARTLELGETFDYIVLSDLVPYVHDLLELFDRVAEHSHERTRVVVNSYSRVWRPVIRLAELLRLKPRKPLRNWVAPHDVVNLLELAGFEPVLSRTRILFPKQIPFADDVPERLPRQLWPLSTSSASRTGSSRARCRASSTSRASRSSARAGTSRATSRELIERLPDFGVPTELIFVEGGSTDDTRGEILRQIEAHPERDIRFVQQTGKGKGDAVRAGFAAAKHDVLMILDGDLSVRPEDLPKFYRGLVDGRAELVNGSRLVYDMEPGAMRFLNMLGNRVFSRLLKAIIGQQVKDTLCGTKVLLRARLRPDRRRPRVLRRVRPVRRLRPALRGRAAQPEDRRPARPLPAADVRRDEHQPLAPRRAAPPDDALRVLEVQGRPAHAPRQSERPRSRAAWARRWAALALATVLDARGASSSTRSRVRSPWWTYADADATLHGGGAQPAARATRRASSTTRACRSPRPSRSSFGARRAARRAQPLAATRASATSTARCSTSTARAGSSAASRSLFYLARRAARVPPRRRGCSATGAGGSRAGCSGSAAPGLVAMSIQFRPDVPLAVLASSSLSRRARGRDARRRVLYVGAAALARARDDGEAARARPARAARARGALATSSRPGDRRGARWPG